MINREIIRLKVVQITYAYYQNGGKNIDTAEKELFFSLGKAYDLYNYLLMLMVEINRIAVRAVETAQNRYNRIHVGEPPSTKFIDNRFILQLEVNKQLLEFRENQKKTWGDEEDFVRSLYKQIVETDYYKEYMSSETRSLAEDCELFIRIFTDEELFEDNEALASYLEDMSLFWTDDLGYVLNSVVRSLETLRRRGMIPEPDVFLKDDDRTFALDLLKAAMTGYDKYMEAVVSSTSNWDPERVVTTDLVLIIQGIAEAVNFPNIPLKVTINEYVDISKYYSTRNSRVFVNGLLDRILRKKTDSGEIVKTGRGLIDN